MEKKRSIGIIVFGIIAILMGIGAFYVFFTKLASYNYSLNKQMFSNPSTAYIIITAPIVAVLFLISGIGILKLRAWAKNMLIGIAVFSLISNLFFVIFKMDSRTPIIMRFIIWLFIIYYFTRPTVKAQFK